MSGKSVPNTETFVGTVKQGALRSWNRVPILIVVVLVLLVGIGAGVWNANYRAKCSSDILTAASRALDPAHQSELPPIAKEVLGVNGYKKDVNCDYIVTAYYIQINDAQKAQSSLNDLQKVYNPKKGFSPKLGYFYVHSIPELKNHITLLIKQSKFTPDTAGYPVIKNPAGTVSKHE